MSPKDGNTVALERRMDLASLFCMIGRHGPAVALAVIAMVSVLAGFIIYRTVRGKRRKATAAAADGDSKSPGDASVIRPGLEPSPEESHSCVESTDVSDEGSSDMKEDTDSFQSDLQIRHRRAAAAAPAPAPTAEIPPPYSPPQSDIQIPNNKHTTSDGTEEMTVVQDSDKVAEASPDLQRDTYTVAEMEVEGAGDCQQDATDDTVKDVIEEVRGNDSCWKEPELINDESHEEEDEVFKAEDQEEENVNIDKDVSDGKTRQEEENFQCASNNQVYFDQAPPMSENVDDDRLQDNETTPETHSMESNLKEPLVHIEDVPSTCVCYSKDEEVEEEDHHPDSTDYSNYSSNRFSPEEEDKKEGEKAEGECVVQQLIPQQVENLPSSQQDQCDDVTDKVTPPIRDSDWDDDGGLAGEVTEVDIAEDHVLTAAKFDVHPPQSDEQQPQIEQTTDENDRTSNQEEGVLPTVADQENNETGEFVEIAPPLDKDADLTILGSDLPSIEKAIQCENNETGEFVVLAEESTDLNNEAFDKSSVAAGPDTIENLTASVKGEEMSCPHLPSIYKDEKSDHVEMVETFDETMVNSATDAAVCDVSITTPAVSQEIYHPDMLSFSQDQQSVQAQNNEDFSEFTISVAPEFDVHPPQSDEQQCQIEQTDENGLTCNQEKGALPAVSDQEREKKLTSEATVPSGEECDSSSVVQSPALHCLNQPVKVDNCDDDVSRVNTDAKAQISGIVDFPDLPLDCQQPQSEAKDEEIAPPLDNDTDLTILDSDLPSLEKEVLCENNETGEFVVLAEESIDLQMINNEAFEKSNAAAGPDTIENLTASVKDEEMSCSHLPSICKDVCDNVTITTPGMSEEISRPDMLSFSQDQQSVQTQNNDFSEFTIGAAPVTTDDLNPPMCHIPLPSFVQSELRDNDKDSMSSPGVGEESGISSMAVSPDLHAAGNEFDLTIEKMMLPVMDCDTQFEERTEAQESVFAAGVVIPVINEDTSGMVFGPYPSRLSQQPHSEHTDDAKYESYATNEDMFGHEIEDSYHRAMEQFVVQIAASTVILTDDPKEQTDVKAVVEVVEIKEKKEGGSVAKKVKTDTEKQKEEEYEKTNISIMEATMDNNEWITDSNNQVLPWMNISVPPFAQDHTTTEQLPTEDLTDATCTDTDTPPSTEVRQTSTLSLVDENTEHNKKVVAVQPMPQNVNVTFRIHYVTHSPYQTVAVTGNQQELGNWKEFVPLERAKDGHWATVVRLPTESHVEWKFVVVDKGEVCRWEECGNRLLDTGYGDDLIVHKWWGFL
ncbi:starch-binding domain-containing protein 1 [Seriola lalandi dorsalis]|uniref:Starch-binding domain-containing protein 1 n=1 Tax=Seriola lalandi dorsalis TaxID=1841481 RepID=A0A3B4YVY8_SERLL|nr:starch-binding domain-containing protein 1 [Seriola lalandi dorsalis]